MQSSLTDPDGSNALVAAAQWVQGTMLGTVATTVAVIAVASVGLLMLSGRIDWRHGATVVIGCFVLFGASSVVAGIQSSATVGDTAEEGFVPLTPAPAPVATPPTRAGDYDPYAGASLPSG